MTNLLNLIFPIPENTDTSMIERRDHNKNYNSTESINNRETFSSKEHTGYRYGRLGIDHIFTHIRSY